MKNILLSVTIFLFLQCILTAQTITGKLVDQNGNGLSGLQLQLYINSKVYTTISTADGWFSFTNITAIKKEVLPAGYSVSDNYPNPFNPKTRISFTLPNTGSAGVEVFNQLGQLVKTETARLYSAGSHYIDLEMNGLPNGFYIAQIILDNKYKVTKKLILLYGSRHLNTTNNASEIKLYKLSSPVTTKLDSLVVTGSYINRTVFTNLPVMQESSLNLGSLKINISTCPEIPSVIYFGKKYNTVQIGSQCWFKENLDVGEMIQGVQNQSNNQKIEKYCYNNDTANCRIYGGFYIWDEALQYDTKEKVQGICPPGWHIPTKAELYDTLSSAVKGDGNSLKREDQGQGSGKGTNGSGFSALLAGYRNDNEGSFSGLGFDAHFWSSTERSASTAYYIVLYYDFSTIYLSSSYKTLGLSVRCLKN